MQIHSRHRLTHGSLANLYFAHCELRSPRTIHGSSRKVRSTLRAAQSADCTNPCFAPNIHMHMLLQTHNHTHPQTHTCTHTLTMHIVYSVYDLLLFWRNARPDIHTSCPDTYCVYTIWTTTYCSYMYMYMWETFECTWLKFCSKSLFKYLLMKWMSESCYTEAIHYCGGMTEMIQLRSIHNYMWFNIWMIVQRTKLYKPTA